MASSMERVSLLLATGTRGRGKGGEGLGSRCLSLPSPSLPSSHCGLTTAIGLVGLKHMGCILGCPLANEVAVLVLVVTGGAHYHGSLLSCLLLLPLGQLLGVQKWGPGAQGSDPNASRWWAPGTARHNSPSASVSPPPSGGPTPLHDGRSPALHLRVQTPGEGGIMGSRLHVHVSSHFSPPRGHRLKGSEWGTQAFYLFEDHDIATFIIFSKGEGCQASHFHHIVSGRGGRTEERVCRATRGLAPSSCGFPPWTFHASLATRFLPPQPKALTVCFSLSCSSAETFS